jgi:hypothetical protein
MIAMREENPPRDPRFTPDPAARSLDTHEMVLPREALLELARAIGRDWAREDHAQTRARQRVRFNREYDQLKKRPPEA